MVNRRFSGTAASGGRFSVSTRTGRTGGRDAVGPPGRIRVRSTTVICVRRGTDVVMAADGQVTMGEAVFKHTAKKIRRLYQDKILAGFAGSTADAFSLFSRFEGKLEQYAGNLGRSAVELAKDWRTDKMLRSLEALLVVADLSQTFLISGSGDVIEPDEGIAAIGSGGIVRAGGSAGADGKHGDGGAGYCGEGAAHCGANLHLHERQDHDRRAARCSR